jgi:superfamily II DNA or RNA helicase/HKD family nuclease
VTGRPCRMHARRSVSDRDARPVESRGMSDLNEGLHEALLTAGLQAQLDTLQEQLKPVLRPLQGADAADRLAMYLGKTIARMIADLPEKDRAAAGVQFVRALLTEAMRLRPGDVIAEDLPQQQAEVLHAVLRPRPDGTPDEIASPLIPLLDTTLLTNAPGEPRVGHQIQTEIRSADQIDVVMAFIRRSGIRPLLEAIRGHCARGRPIRILTTTYTGSTEAMALEDLRSAGAEVRVSYDTTTTRLHAKAWLFHRRTGLSTAYVGSSNLTHSAQVTGLEWNVRLSETRNADVLRKVAAVFESYWNGGDFIPFDAEVFRKHLAASTASGPRIFLSPVELRPEPFQERLLEQIQLSRSLGEHRNLLVSATGTGKTVMAALDYAHLRTTLKRSRLLFVAHRREILDQSLATFRYCLREPAFGELWVGDQRPERFEHVFASIQMLASKKMADLEAKHFDVVIIDEFHHAAATSYTTLLDHVQPVELLGLTATPERSDGLPLLERFGGKIAAELRLWDAIEQHRLCPFLYFGVHDGLDLREIPFTRGRGYDIDRLSTVLTADESWARLVVHEVARRVDDPLRMRALGFCVSIAHARFMAAVFTKCGIAATAVWADSSESEREAALKELAAGRLNAVFSVDLFNEGIDVPNVDTLLLLRPTDSPVLFLQQLGRGLRRSLKKDFCTVLDFVGRHRTEFRFDRRLGALLGVTRRGLIESIEAGFPFLPAGCHMELDPVAREIVLSNIRAAVPTRWSARVAELQAIAKGRSSVKLSEFLEESTRELSDVYSGGKSWSDLCQDAGLSVLTPGRHEEALRRACGRMTHVDDRPRIDAYVNLLSQPVPPTPEALSVQDRRLLRMLIASMTDQVVDSKTTLAEGASLLWEHPQVRSELRELLLVLRDRLTHVVIPLLSPPAVPLQVHACYTRLEILAAAGVGDGAQVAAWQTGIHWAEAAHADLLAFTLDKSSGNFSPTTRYRDYAVSPDLIHWESQSITRESSETGRRYQGHATLGTHVLLFARLRTTDRAFWFLGPATYVRHEGERPMAVTWRLHHPLPGDLFAEFAAAVA